MIYPIVEYAKLINKNTAEFTTTDLVNFTKWWMKRPNSKEILQAIKNQQIRAASIGKEIQSNRKEDKMLKGSKQENAYRSRLTSEQLDELEIEDVGEETVEVLEGSEVVATLDLMRSDIDALLFAITTVFTDYEMSGHEYEASLTGIKEGLEGV